MIDLSGEVAIVTGGSRGIGRSVVKHLAKAGAKVVDLDDASLAKWQALAKPVWKDYADKNENCAKLLALAEKLL